MDKLCRLIYLYRLVALNVTIFELVGNPDRAGFVLGALLVAAFASYMPLRWLSRGDAAAADSPLYLAGDFVLTMAILAVLGADSPFYLYTLGTPLLAGVLFGRRGAAVMAVAMLAAYYAVLIGRGGSSLSDFPTLVTQPFIYLGVAAGGAAVRRLYEAERAAVAGAERTRVAREMHDSLGKTLYGVALSARGLARRTERDSPELGRMANDLYGAAQRAAAEARELIGDLRSDTVGASLHTVVTAHVQAWSDVAGVPATIDAQVVDLPHPGTRYELFAVLKEALRNVERHAGASRIEVALRPEGADVLLRVSDDGAGIPGATSEDPRELEPEGHYGLIGMVERAERIGGRVEIACPPGRGTQLTLRVPSGDVRTAEPWAAAPPQAVVS